MTTTIQTIPESLLEAMKKYYTFCTEEECVPGQATRNDAGYLRRRNDRILRKWILKQKKGSESTMTTSKYPAIQKIADEIGEPVYETIERLDYMRFQKMVNIAHNIQNPSSPILTNIEVIEQGSDILNTVLKGDDEYGYKVYCAGCEVIRVMFDWDVLDELNEWEEANF